MQVITKRDRKEIAWEVTDEIDPSDRHSDGELQQWVADVGAAWVFIRLKIHLNGDGRLDSTAYELTMHTISGGLMTEESWDTLVEALVSGSSMLADYVTDTGSQNGD